MENKTLKRYLELYENDEITNHQMLILSTTVINKRDENIESLLSTSRKEMLREFELDGDITNEEIIKLGMSIINLMKD
ncbi:hypothetical protein [Vibrio splendidus]|uniref:hypothetical protein n=1 Tax=Vibrio splendidus TaxID=29497 RepID=UPI003D0B0B81